MGYVTGDTILDDEYIAFVSATGAPQVSILLLVQEMAHLV